jgi:hypothetical protein
MLIDGKDREFARQLWHRCDPKIVLTPTHEFYEPLYDYKYYPESEDRVERLFSNIDFEGSESCQFFSGFSGSGKSTELQRLQVQLESAGYLVLYTNALEYINETDPLDIADMLLVIAGAFGDALTDPKALGKETHKESYWDRFVRFLHNEIELKETSVKAEYAWLKELKTGIDIKTALKATPTFRSALHALLKNSAESLRQDVYKFISEGYDQIKKKHPGAAGRVVFIIDDFEKIRGTRDSEQEVIQSVKFTFANHLEKLALNFLHVIYTVPPWLRLASNNICHTEILPSIRLWDRTPDRTPYVPGMTAVRNVIRRRFDFPKGTATANLTRTFGAPDAEGNYTLLDELIRGSGGHLRDLLRLVRQVVQSARTLPVTQTDVDRELRNYRQDFLPIAIDDALLLDRIGRQQNYVLQDTEPASILQFYRFLDRQLVLYLTNGDEWYDVHPLLRTEIARIVEEELVERKRSAPDE